MNAPTRARHATRVDLDAAAITLSRAFDDDPVMGWLMPNAAARAAAMPGFYRVLAGIALDHDSLLVADAPGHPAAGVAIWLPPGAWPVPLRRAARVVGPALRGMRTRARHGIRTTAAMDRRHHRVEEPHWYLEVLGSDPDVRGRGFGAAVIEPVLERCDTEGVAAYLESSKAENLPYYERFGWRVVEEFRVTPSAPPLWTMLRPAR